MILGGMDPLMVKYNESIYYDRILHAQDIQGSIAWARANHQSGILSASEFQKIEEGLRAVEKEWKDGTFEIRPGVDEDIHTANERRLGELIGKEIGGKLHTGRSRNEQIAADMRLWLRDELRKIEVHLIDLLKIFAGRAEKDIEVVMPGYTHLQPAQPVRWSQWLLSYASAFANDLERLRHVIPRVNRSPLGSGALAGNPFRIDRAAIAKELGFDDLIWNSMAAVADRDFVAETMQWGSMLMLHMSRMAEDLIIYGSAEFGFVRLADAYSTGSSLMPQKKNADSMELLRGKTGRAFGQMAGFMMTLKGLPSTYDKDLQESLEPIIDHIRTVDDSIQIAAGVLSTLSINRDRMSAALQPEMLATDLADYLVRKGVPFRESHHISGQIVQLSEKSSIPMDKLSFEQIHSVDSRFERDVLNSFDFQASVELRSTLGGTSKSSIKWQIEQLIKVIEPK